ncbi:hypothetical protein [Rhizobium sp. L245/93]|uniref:hypothetical protein n=1 Tax=Rhizobium sp. L245/93 TaxID=2819998 RepID=UPI001ADB8353|nr:hypothetical protein [Rhizobium sp. L245/93]MBO9168359.1 hypothetical protein [Rhizobium sp. L245/93]
MTAVNSGPPPLDPQAYQYLAQIAKYSTWAFGLIVLGVTIVMVVAFYKSGNGPSILAKLIVRAGTLQMITVIVIVVGACILATIGRISPEGIVSILSGIAGYVLGNSTRPREGLPKDEEQS